MSDPAVGRSPLDALAKPERRTRDGDRSSQSVVTTDSAQSEQLRQEQVTFDQLARQTAAWGTLRLAMGWAALILLVALCMAAIFVLVEHKHFPSSALTVAASTMLVEVVALVAAVWRLVLKDGPPQLAPVTRAGGPPS